jgi:hypothetical protein
MPKTDTEAKTKATASAAAKTSIPRLDPDPGTKNKPKEPAAVAADPPKESAKKEEKVEPVGKGVVPKVAKELEVGPGYDIRLLPGSGYWITCQSLAEMGHFKDIVTLLSSPNFDPTNKQQAADLVSKILVGKGDLEERVRTHPSWDQHAQKRTKRLKDRAKNDTAAKKTLDNERRVKSGRWIGNFKEIISVCVSSATKDNRNVKKFHKAGVIIDQYPAEPAKRDDPVFIMMYPKQYRKKVVAALATHFKKT